MEQGTGNVIPLAEAQRTREDLGLNAAAASREAEKRGVNIAGQVIRSMERGRDVMDTGRLYAYLRVLWELREEARNGTSGSVQEPDSKTVADLIVSINALGSGIDHFVSSGLSGVSSRDLQLLTGTLNAAHSRFKSTAAILQGAASTRHGSDPR